MSGLESRPIDPGVGVGLDQPPGRLAGPHPELENALGRERDRRHRLLLQLVVARDLGADPLQVLVGCPVELAHLVTSLRRCHLIARSSTSTGLSLSFGRGHAARPPGRARAARARRPDLRAAPEPVAGAARRLAAEPRLRLPPALPAPRRGPLHALPRAGAASRPRSTPARSTSADTDDEELRSPYVDDDELDVGRWAHDAAVLALPTQVLCRPDCAGLCPVCGESLNDADPADHEHDSATGPPLGQASNELEARASERRRRRPTALLLVELGDRFLVATGEAVAAALHGGEELLQVDLEGVEDLVGVVLGAESDLALTGAGVLDDLVPHVHAAAVAAKVERYADDVYRTHGVTAELYHSAQRLTAALNIR